MKKYFGINRIGNANLNVVQYPIVKIKTSPALKSDVFHCPPNFSVISHGSVVNHPVPVIKWKNKIYNTVRTVSKPNSKILETGKIDTLARSRHFNIKWQG